MGNHNHHTHEEIKKAQKEFTDMVQEHWVNEDLFGWDWWLVLAVTIFPWIIWWKLLDRTRKAEIILYGLLITLLSTLLDIIGWSLHLWSYVHKLIPIYPPMIPADFTIIPVTYMLIYQYFRNWQSFFVAMVIVSLVFSFIGEPILIWLEFYEEIHWKHIYSFPTYIAIGLCMKWLTGKIMS